MIRLWIWTIRNHDKIVYLIRTYSLCGSFLVVFMAVGGVVSLEAALMGLALGGAGMIGLIVGCSEMRRRHLKSITDPSQKQLVHMTLLRGKSI